MGCECRLAGTVGGGGGGGEQPQGRICAGRGGASSAAVSACARRTMCSETCSGRFWNTITATGPKITVQ